MTKRRRKTPAPAPTLTVPDDLTRWFEGVVWEKNDPAEKVIVRFKFYFRGPTRRALKALIADLVNLSKSTL